MYALVIRSEPDYLSCLEALLYEHIAWGWEENAPGRVTAHFSQEKQAIEFQELVLKACPKSKFELESVQDKDWSEDWKQFFTPIEIGNTFVILPDWLGQTPSELEKIVITPKMAFGTGHHPTTCLCLEKLSGLYSKGLIPLGANFLDLGTGSGILGIACSRLGFQGIGLDIDQCAIDNAEENIVLNNVQDRFQVWTGDITSLDKGRKFNLIFANILAPTLKELAFDILSLLDTAGYCLVLSGILDQQARDVADEYVRLGMDFPEITHHGEWSALVWCKLPHART
ncbi:50S ribosomal protein L11 methyltransferase [Desulfonatronovibrio hydrogenovorans]|uniref:50S ribosomal protein L11 methyltransferase n=1 Tax=Desulfonatronovibrio hydrogenovorans TaxID=53245 RepID=UPI00048BC49E|nr:50S ribosomal protein L11 methyltransferase [Desulfonatronovibrio hydrogenovorans]